MRYERYDCAAVGDALALAVGGDQVLSPAEQRHLKTCLRCQVERIRYRTLLRELRSLRRPSPADTGQLEREILSKIDDHDQRWVRRVSSRASAAVGGVAAGAVVTAGVVALAVRRRAVRLA